MNLLEIIKDYLPGMFSPTKISHKETRVGAGYYALRKTVSAAGKVYTKLVKADRSNTPKVFNMIGQPKRVPSRGSRTDRPSTRRARRDVPKAA